MTDRVWQQPGQTGPSAQCFICHFSTSLARLGLCFILKIKHSYSFIHCLCPSLPLGSLPARAVHTQQVPNSASALCQTHLAVSAKIPHSAGPHPAVDGCRRAGIVADHGWLLHLPMATSEPRGWGPDRAKVAPTLCPEQNQKTPRQKQRVVGVSLGLVENNSSVVPTPP